MSARIFWLLLMCSQVNEPAKDSVAKLIDKTSMLYQQCEHSCVFQADISTSGSGLGQSRTAFGSYRVVHA